MTAQSRGALIDNRRAHKQHLSQSKGDASFFRPDLFAERLIRLVGAFDQRQGVRQRRTGQFHANLHGLSMAQTVGQFVRPMG